MQLIIPMMPEVLYALASFLILFVLLAKFAFPPIVAMMDKREHTIRESIEKAEETRIEAERLLEDYKRQLAEARTEAAQVIEQARKLGDDAKAKIEADAHEESAKILARAREEIEAEKNKAIVELTGKVADLSIGAASAVVSRALTKADHAKLIEDFIKQAGGVSEN